MSLKVENLDVSVGTKCLLSGINIECPSGSFIGVIGANGAGKSTLLNVMAGLNAPNSGSVNIDSKNIFEYSASELSILRAVLPQHSDLSFPLNAIEVVRLALSLSAMNVSQQQELLTDCMSRFNVLHLANQNYLTLSGGERQRVQLARVTAQLFSNQHRQKHQYLLLDEPISALDLYQQYQTLDALKLLAKEGIGIIAVLHDLNLASLYCDHLVVLKHGYISAQGSPTQVINESSLKSAFNIDVWLQAHPDTQAPFITPRISQ